MKYIDIHSHLNLPNFDQDIEDVVQRLKDSETCTIVVGTDLETSKKAVELAEKYTETFACVGIHPVGDPTRIFEKEQFEGLMSHPKVVAVGECGLDFFHQDKNDTQEVGRQKKLFLDQIEFAVEHDLPIMIHSRDAYLELLNMLEPLKEAYGEKLRGDVHFFAGTLEEAQRFWNINFATSFTGVITFTHDYDEVIKNAPLEMLMSETDAPFVAPVPYRG
ncbi:MAG: sec-independent protein translocase protein TatD DNase family protein, partial [Parcubacteria group bacterium]|nr:sec-independent protein translocase protein TatD DNase family protein [Parcubacteria group bacterium]